MFQQVLSISFLIDDINNLQGCTRKGDKCGKLSKLWLENTNDEGTIY